MERMGDYWEWAHSQSLSPKQASHLHAPRARPAADLFPPQTLSPSPPPDLSFWEMPPSAGAEDEVHLYYTEKAATFEGETYAIHCPDGTVLSRPGRLVLADSRGQPAKSDGEGAAASAADGTAGSAGSNRHGRDGDIENGSGDPSGPSEEVDIFAAQRRRMARRALKGKRKAASRSAEVELLAKCLSFE